MLGLGGLRNRDDALVTQRPDQGDLDSVEVEALIRKELRWYSSILWAQIFASGMI